MCMFGGSRRPYFMRSLRILCLFALTATLACAPIIRPQPRVPETGLSTRFVGLYEPGFERQRFRTCRRWVFVGRDPWRIVFTDAALAQRNWHLARLEGHRADTASATAGRRLLVVVIGRVSAETPKPLGVEPRRTLLVDRVLLVRQPGLILPCAGVDRETAGDPSHLASGRISAN